jgi:outer membrane lipoprotein-sorting protein
MKKIMSLGLAAIALMFIFSMFAVSETRAQGGPTAEILKRMDEHQKALRSLQANVQMAKYNAQLQETDVTEGSVMYLPAKGRDALVRIDWTRPIEETFSVVNKQYVICRPRLKQCYTGSSKDAKGNGKAGGALAFMNMSKEQLKANFNHQYLGQENVSTGAPAWHLKLTPKTPASYQYGEIWVDGNGMLIQMKVTENNNDSTTVLLSNLQKNVTLDASKFKVVIPKDWKIVKG